MTPHAWANDAFLALIGHGASIGGIATKLAVASGYATALMALATWPPRRALTAA